MAKSNQFVFTKKTALMQRLADLVRGGHVRYVCGTIQLEKAAQLATKFDRLYQPNLPRLQAHRRRAQGEATARLLWWQDASKPEQLTWFLLLTDGELTVDGLESWRDPLNTKTRIHLTGYELVRLTKPTEPKPVWTWRYDKQRLQDLRDQLVTVIRLKHDHEVERLIAMLWASPGFAGIREQVKGCGELIRAEWKRSRGSSDNMPVIPTRLGYVQRLADKGVMLNQLEKLRSKNV